MHFPTVVRSPGEVCLLQDSRSPPVQAVPDADLIELGELLEPGGGFQPGQDGSASQAMEGQPRRLAQFPDFAPLVVPPARGRVKSCSQPKEPARAGVVIEPNESAPEELFVLGSKAVKLCP